MAEQQAGQLFTVVLLYPDYATDGDVETYIESARADCAEDAVGIVQFKAHIAQVDSGTPPDDFRPVAVFEGEPVLELSVQDMTYSPVQ